MLIYLNFPIKYNLNYLFRKGLLICILFFTSSYNCFSQLKSEDLPLEFYHEPKSPTIANLGIFGEHPVNLSTGLVDISVPIYTIKEGDIEVPISLSYHASGVKVYDQSGLYGVKWNLNAGGVIMASKKFPINRKSISRESMMEWSSNNCAVHNSGMTNINAPNFEPYQYSYSFPGHNGKIYVDANDDCFFVPRQKLLKINGFEKGLSSDIVQTIIDENGIKYNFGTVESTINNVGTYGQLLSRKAYCSASFLDNIIAPDGSKVEFEYEENNYTSESGHLPILSQWNRKFPKYTYVEPCKPFFDLTTIDSYNEYKSYKLTEIKTEKVKLKFSYKDPDATIDGNMGSQLLNFIAIYSRINGKDKLLKKYIITYTNNGRYNISVIDVHDENDRFVYNYKFFYKDGHIEKPNYYGIDYYGYHNGADNNVSLIPNTIATYDEAVGKTIKGNADRTVGTIENTARGILDSIAFPTGGSSSFEYEHNRALNKIGAAVFEEEGYLAPGVRIKTICNYNTGGDLMKTKNYQYEPGFSSFGTEYVEKSECNLCARDLIICPSTYSKIFSHPKRNFGVTNSGFVSYAKVSEVIDGQGRIEYTYDNKQDYFFGGAYTRSKESPRTPRGYKRGRILEKNYYEEGTDNIIRKEKYNYQDLIGAGENKPVYIHGMVYSKIIKENVQFKTQFKYFNVCCDNAQFVNRFAFEFYTIESDYIGLVSKKVINYLKEGEVSELEEYSYNNMGQINKVGTTLSNGDKLTHHTLYPKDYNSGFANTLSSNNILNKPIETYSVLNNSKVIKGNLTTYNAFGLPSAIYKLNTQIDGLNYNSSNGFKPSNTNGHVSISKNYIKEFDLDKYAKSNLLHFEKINGNETSLIWGFNGQYIVANIENIDYQTAINSPLLKQLDDFTTEIDNNSMLKLRNINTQIRKSLPSKALVNTYTHKPLIGITSHTDPNGITTFYDYDDFGRLKCVRDNNRIIIKSYDYHYSK